MKNSKVLKVVALIPLLLLLISLIYIYINYVYYQKANASLENKQKNIDNHYSEYVKTNKETKLYKKDKNNYIEYGEINNKVSLKLTKKDKEYFLIDGLDLYIKYIDVTPTKESINDERYKNYIYFNKNIKTQTKTKFYDENNNFIYSINESFDFKVLIKDNGKYGVVYNDKLLYIKESDVEKEYDNNNSSSNKEKIRVLTYHFLYNEKTSECDQVICQSFEQLESHLKYIRENNYFTLRLNELEMYLDGKINIGDKSIVLTVDDGTIFDREAIKLMEKYKTNFTMFAVTSWVNPKDFESKYLDLESHTDNMHNQYECKGHGTQGGGILCLDEEKVLNDLSISKEKLNGSDYFAYPFFDFNERAISLVKKAGFHMAFIGQYTTDGYSSPHNTNKYKVPRKTIFSTTSMDEFKSYLK